MEEKKNCERLKRGKTKRKGGPRRQKQNQRRVDRTKRGRKRGETIKKGAARPPPKISPLST
jgi:hypothetical protein